MTFDDKEFKSAANEMHSPDLEGWEALTESHGVKIYRMLRPQSKLYEYKVVGTAQIQAETCAAVYMDIKYRKSWDSYASELAYIRKTDPSIIYWEVAYPWPMSHRDYVYLREMEISTTEDGLRVWTILGRSAKANELSPREQVDRKKGVIRVTDYKQSMVIKDNGDGTSQIFMHYFDNPQGMIPAMVVNWAAKTGVPGFLTTLEEACRKYAAYQTSC